MLLKYRNLFINRFGRLAIIGVYSVYDIYYYFKVQTTYLLYLIVEVFIYWFYIALACESFIYLPLFYNNLELKFVRNYSQRS